MKKKAVVNHHIGIAMMLLDIADDLDDDRRDAYIYAAFEYIRLASGILEGTHGKSDNPPDNAVRLVDAITACEEAEYELYQAATEYDEQLIDDYSELP